jgi:hypothetical protein
MELDVDLAVVDEPPTIVGVPLVFGECVTLPVTVARRRLGGTTFAVDMVASLSADRGARSSLPAGVLRWSRTVKTPHCPCFGDPGS